jgi:hypothetical protein
MRLLKLNPFLLALIFSVLIESVSVAVYMWLGSTHGYGTFTDFYCRSFLFLHEPAVELTKLFSPGGHWPSLGTYIMFATFSLGECWIISLVGIFVFRRLCRKFGERDQAA